MEDKRTELENTNTLITNLIEPDIESTKVEGNNDLIVEESVEETPTETKQGDPYERFTKKPLNKVKAQNRNRKKIAKKSKSKNRK